MAAGDSLSWVLSRTTRGIPHDRRLVLVFLAGHADRNGWVFVSVARLAEEMALGESTVHRAIREAIERGWLGERQCDCPVPPAYAAIQRNRRPRLLSFLGCHQCDPIEVPRLTPQWDAKADSPVAASAVIDFQEAIFQRTHGGRTA